MSTFHLRLCCISPPWRWGSESKQLRRQRVETDRVGSGQSVIELRVTSAVAHVKIISGSWCLNHLVETQLSQPAADVSSPPALWCEQERLESRGAGGGEVSFSASLWLRWLLIAGGTMRIDSHCDSPISHLTAEQHSKSTLTKFPVFWLELGFAQF